MSEGRVERRLTAILAVDVAGYSRLMGVDEEGTLRNLKAHRSTLLDPNVAEHRGRIVKTTGDGLLAEFQSVVDAVRCAVEVQRGMIERNTATPEGERIEFRIGVNLGDVIVDDGDIFGDGVNIAARLEALAEPGGICLSASAHEQVRDKLDLAFEDIGEQRVKNIARPIRAYRVRPQRAPLPLAGEGSAPTRVGVDPAPALPGKPSIAVLPFQNMSGDPDQEYFADGMVEEIITALSRIRWLFVIARNSSFTYKGAVGDVKRVGRELGVRYVLEGSVRKAGGRVRISAQLVEAESGAHLWADRFDGSLEDVFDLQDKVALSVAGVIEPTLERAETRRSLQRPTADLTAYDLYLRALPEFGSWEKHRVIRALDLVDRAIALDPQYSPALALAAHSRTRIDLGNWTDDPAANRLEGVRLARRALQSGADNPIVLVNAGLALGYFGEDLDAALRLVDRALALNPSYFFGWLQSGWLHLFADRTTTAIEHFETSLRLDPRGNRGNALAGIGLAHFFSRRFDEALEKLLLALEESPSFVTGHRFLAACYAHLGRLREAREVIERLRAMNPAVLDESATRFRNPERRELYLSGLRLAMAGELS
jgi:adenylate cyclase